ncbi:hypothetical protein [Streptomyces abyssomicinicus]|uniref:hypothetical protein n=1 Tax=Streptomyces abyssomicinicus TaxID=574929 RepID=UPI00124FC8AC|nr:hypothetical protein [Streptomyces abyssomicinicus]
MIRYRIEQIGDLPPAFAAALGVLLLLLIAGLVGALLWLPDSSKLRSPAARERARRRAESRKRQKALRRRREALQRKARGRGDT